MNDNKNFTPRFGEADDGEPRIHRVRIDPSILTSEEHRLIQDFCRDQGAYQFTTAVTRQAETIKAANRDRGQIHRVDRAARPQRGGWLSEQMLKGLLDRARRESCDPGLFS